MVPPMNNCSFIGRAVRDAESQTLGSGTELCKFTIAVDGYKPKDGGEGEVMFLDCTLWGNRAKVGQYIKKGRKYGVSGQLRLERWESNGQKRQKHVLNVLNFEFCEPKRDDDPAPSNSNRSEPTPPPADFDDDIPF